MNEFIGATSVVAGMFMFALWVDDKSLKFSLFVGILGVISGLSFVIIPTNPEPEKPAYSSEWIDEETKCHFYDGNPVSCESVRYE